MKRLVCLLVLVGFGLAVASAAASPNVTSAVLHPRVWDDFPGSTLTWGNTYARNAPNNEAYIGGDGSIFFNDVNNAESGWANRHMWRYSENTFNDAVFNNGDAFDISADVTITGPANTEAALEIAPWWSPDVGGGLTVITWNGEIAAFGGRMPFYSFTVEQGLTYTKDETIGLGIQYLPRSLTEEDPGLIKYNVTQGGTDYTSGWIPFDFGGGEGYGAYGILDDARVGGYCLPQLNAEPDDWSKTEWDNIRYYPVPEPTSLVLFGLMGLAAARRRR